MRVTLPWPKVLANKRLKPAKGGGFYKDEGDEAWQRGVLLLLKSAGCEPLRGEVELDIWLYRPNPRIDWDAPLKMLSDALEGGAYLDDNQVADAHVHKRLDRENPRIEVAWSPSAGEQLALSRSEEARIAQISVLIDGRALKVASDRLRPAVSRPGDKDR